MIRITGGSARGRVLRGSVPSGVRPTSSRVREALFNVLGNDLTGWSMVDLFGGTGLVAMEAASRGAAPVIVVERNPLAAAAIRANALSVALPLDVRIGDAATVSLPRADLFFLDPPYRDPPAPWLARASALADRIVVVEARTGVDPGEAPSFIRDHPRPYGDTTLWLYERVGEGAGAEERAEVAEDGAVIEREGGG